MLKIRLKLRPAGAGALPELGKMIIGNPHPNLFPNDLWEERDLVFESSKKVLEKNFLS